MYNIEKEGEFPLELGIKPFHVRLRKLLLKGRKIIYIKNEFDNSTFRYRYYNVAQSIEGQEDINVTCFLSKELELIYNYIDTLSLIVLQRAMWDIDIENFIFIAKNKGIPIIYDIDDLILNPKYIPLYLNNLGILSEDSGYFDVHFAFASKYYAVACKCDGFLTTNKYLAEVLKDDFSKPVWVIPNFLNKEQEYHSEIVRKKRKKNSSQFVIGYFSGSPSHKGDFSIIVDEIEKLLKKYEDIYLKIAGYIEIPEELYAFRDRIIKVPFVSFEELQYEIGKVDLNIVPLQNNLFNNCKSELKYFEAGIVNVVSCCSPTYIYKQIIKNGQNGFLCKEGEWFSTIERIYLGKENLEEIGKNAYKTSINLYGNENQVEGVITTFNQILGYYSKGRG